MPKSKEFVSSSSASGSESEDEPRPKKKKTEKKPEKKSPQKSSSSKASSTMTGANGETMYEIGKMKYASVSTFKGKKYVNIREYYHDNSGDLKPGRKGISLPREQWESLKNQMEALDAELKN